MQIQTLGVLAPTSTSSALSETSHSISTNTNAVVAQSKTHRSKFYNLLLNHLSNLGPVPSLPSKLETQHVQNISFQGIDFSDGKSSLTFPKDRLIDSLEMTNCKKFRLSGISVKNLNLQNCSGVFFNTSARVTETIKAIHVTFNIFPCKNLSSTLRELVLGYTHVNNLCLPLRLEVFIADHLRCGTIRLGTKSFAPKLTSLKLGDKFIEWKDGEQKQSLWTLLENVGSDEIIKT